MGADRSAIDRGVLRIWTIKGFPGHWPVGTAAVVIAKSKEDAAAVLTPFLAKNGIGPAQAEAFEELPMNEGAIALLCDGDY